VLEDHQHLLAEYSAVQQALSELGAVYNDAPIGMAVVGTDFRFKRINARLAQMNGAPIEAHLGRTMRELVPKIADFAEAVVTRIAETGEPLLNQELAGETAAEPGVERSFVVHWSPATGSNGRVVAVNIVVEEVTAQRRAAEALRASEARLREVLESIKDAFLVMDHDFRIIQMNREALRIDGRPFGDIAGRTHWEVWPASVGTPVEAAYRRVMADRVPVTLEHHFVSGEHDLWLDISAYPTSDGVALFYRDITERRQSEERLKESERRLATAIRAGQLGVFEYSYRSLPCYYWDRTVRSVWGVGEDEVIGEEVFWDSLHPDDLPMVLEASERGEDPNGNRRYDVEYRIHRRSDNALRWVKVASDIVFDEAGPVKMIGTVQDITDRKMAEEQTLLLMREVNHRSKNLLAVVQSIAHQMARGADPASFAQRFSERLASLASSQDLLVRSQWRGVDLEALVASQLAHYQHLVGRRIHIAGERFHVSASAAQNLGMALHELATNAAKYGGLSGSRGEVSINWGRCVSNDQFNISWTESGGPPVTAPTRKGLGSLIVTRLLERALEGKVQFQFDPDGLRWSLTAPASALLEARGADGS
jgi:PAS domain S-box-containing protein